MRVTFEITPSPHEPGRFMAVATTADGRKAAANGDSPSKAVLEVARFVVDRKAGYRDEADETIAQRLGRTGYCQIDPDTLKPKG